VYAHVLKSLKAAPSTAVVIYLETYYALKRKKSIKHFSSPGSKLHGVQKTGPPMAV